MASLVSIIVPVYNLENYIENCLNSLLNQTYRNLEILCIDDGSTDLSNEKISNLAKKDSRIVYVFKENSGVSSTRNMGLETATGDYVMFIDGDDYIHPQAVEFLVKGIEDTNADVVCSDFIETFETNHCQGDFQDVSFNILPLDKFFDTVSPFVYRSSCGKLFTKRAAKSAIFPTGISNGEDTVYLFKVLDSASCVAYTDAKLYYYFQRHGSASNSEFKPDSVSMIDAFLILCEYMYERKSDFLLYQSFLYLYKTIFSIRTICIGTEYEKSVLEKCKAASKAWQSEFYKNPNTDFKTKIVYTAFIYSRRLYEFMRLKSDPTMKDFYKKRKAIKNQSKG